MNAELSHGKFLTRLVISTLEVALIQTPTRQQVSIFRRSRTHSLTRGPVDLLNRFVYSHGFTTTEPWLSPKRRTLRNRIELNQQVLTLRVCITTLRFWNVIGNQKLKSFVQDQTEENLSSALPLAPVCNVALPKLQHPVTGRCRIGCLIPPRTRFVLERRRRGR